MCGGQCIPMGLLGAERLCDRQGALCVEVNASLWRNRVRCGCVTARGRCVWRAMNLYGVTGCGALFTARGRCVWRSMHHCGVTE